MQCRCDGELNSSTGVKASTKVPWRSSRPTWYTKNFKRMLTGESPETAIPRSNHQLKDRRLPSPVHLQTPTLAQRKNRRTEKGNNYSMLMTVQYTDHLTNGANATKISTAITSSQEDLTKHPISLQDIPNIWVKLTLKLRRQDHHHRYTIPTIISPFDLTKPATPLKAPVVRAIHRNNKPAVIITTQMKTTLILLVIMEKNSKKQHWRSLTRGHMPHCHSE